MIQFVLFFALGFLCAGFVALMVAPAIWRRAVSLTRKRVEAAVPSSMNEIQADKDRLRAEFAMAARKLEMSLKSTREKAAAQSVEIGRNQVEMKRLSDDRAERDKAVSAHETRNGELAAELDRRDGQLRKLSERLAEAERKMEERAIEFEKLGRMYDEAALTSSNRQIDLVARETEIDKLAADIEALRGESRESRRLAEETAAEAKLVREALKAEKKKAAEMERKLERLIATNADLEEKLERRERELARLREQAKGDARAGGAIDAEISQIRAEKARLQSEVAALTRQMSLVLPEAKGGDANEAVVRLGEERDRLEARLTALTRENKKLRASLSAQERAGSDNGGEERRENALLREQIHELAAEVVNMTATLEGPDSPIRKALAGPVSELPQGPHDRITSLAERVKALQKEAPLV